MSEVLVTDPNAMPGETAEQAVTAAAGQQEIFLGYEHDACSGQLSVVDRNGVLVPIPRGSFKTVDVAIDGDGYWYWQCGSSKERSRGEPNYRPRVKRLKMFHDPDSRDIQWNCYDLL
jgi:hypothetical protein